MKKRRPDISNALIHLTGNRSSNGGLTAENALHSILRNRVIEGSGNNGYIKGNNLAVCLTEMPLSSVKYFIHDGYKKHKYEYFGIAMSKSSGWKIGARPVIYLPDNEACWIPHEEKWRHVQFDMGDVDFTHEREWRIKGDLSLCGFGFYVIVPEKEYEKKIKNDDSINMPNIIGFLHMEYLNDLM